MEAKTTITGCFAVWSLIHNPSTRILIISAGSTLAKEISTWCIQIINQMPELSILRCDKSHPGARASVEAYDVHWMLKGPDKSPSLKCIGITSNMAGSRADLLIADDIESPKNASTELMRQQLRHLTLDFTSMNSHGKILYLGTPQSTDSIYNGLPSRSFDVRIWPGRYPTPAEMVVYGDHLAPALLKRIEEDPSVQTGGGPIGDQGKPTDPGMMDESTLTGKQIDQGKAYYNLQFMLNTALMDSDKYPLKLKDLVFFDFDLNECPGSFSWTNESVHRIDFPSGSHLPKESIYYARGAHQEMFNYSIRLMSIDPAGGGQNGDETGVSIIFECNGYLIVQHVTGVPGGTSPDKFQKVVDLIQQYSINKILVEKNFGNGAYTEALRGALIAAEVRCDIEEIWASGQKELRIIDNLEPVIGSHKLIVSRSVLDEDVQSTQKYGAEQRASYQLFFQMCKITRDRGSLIHDDRLDSLAQGVSYLVKSIATNADLAIARKKQQKLNEYKQDPYGVWRNAHKGFGAIAGRPMGTALGRFSR